MASLEYSELALAGSIRTPSTTFHSGTPSLAWLARLVFAASDAINQSHKYEVVGNDYERDISSF